MGLTDRPGVRGISGVVVAVVGTFTDPEERVVVGIFKCNLVQARNRCEEVPAVVHGDGFGTDWSAAIN